MVPAATDRPAHREASPVPLIRQRWSIENEWHWARDAQLGEDAHRNTYCTGVLIPAHGGDEPAATRGLPLDSPGPAGARLRHQGNAGPGRGGGACSHELITLLGSPGEERIAAPTPQNPSASGTSSTSRPPAGRSSSRRQACSR